MANKSNSLFKKGSGVYNCGCCKRATRSTGGDGADVGLCDICYDLAGEENSLSDSGKLYDSPENVMAMIAAVKAKGGDASCWDELDAAAASALIVKNSLRAAA
jgi:hypothetical protein